MCELTISRSAVNIEPAICNGHLPFPWCIGRRGGEGRKLDSGGGGVGGAERVGEGRVRRLFRIHELAYRNL